MQDLQNLEYRQPLNSIHSNIHTPALFGSKITGEAKTLETGVATFSKILFTSLLSANSPGPCFFRVQHLVIKNRVDE